MNRIVSGVKAARQLGMQFFREKEALAPDGSADVEKETGSEEPITRFAVIVLVVEAPWITDGPVELIGKRKVERIVVALARKGNDCGCTKGHGYGSAPRQ
jgi:hypothetical protein